MKIKISKLTVDKLARGQTVWDTAITGFGVRRQRSETRNFILKTQVNKKQKQFTIGKYGQPFTVDMARNEAKKLLGQIAAGNDPRATAPNKNIKLDIIYLSYRYLKEYAEENKKPSSVKTDRSNIKNHIIPLLGDNLICELKKQDIEKFKRNVKDGVTATGKKRNYKGGGVVKGGSGIANRCLALLSKMLNCALEWELRVDGVNPVKGVQHYNENAIERYLSIEETRCLAQAIIDEKDVSLFAALAFELLLMTGARRGDILNLKWEYVDFEQGIAFLPDSKAGKKQLFLSPEVASLLKAVPREFDNPFVICGKIPGKPFVGIGKVWGRIRLRAVNLHWREKFPNAFKFEEIYSPERLVEALTPHKISSEDVNFLNGLRIHDLRHNFASVFASAGHNIYELMRILGHKNINTTLRYVHLFETTLRTANDSTAALILERISGKLND